MEPGWLVELLEGGAEGGALPPGQKKVKNLETIPTTVLLPSMELRCIHLPMKMQFPVNFTIIT